MSAAVLQKNPRLTAGSKIPVCDVPLLLAVIGLFCLGLIMVASSSIAIADRQMGEPLFYLQRQLLYALMGIGLVALLWRIPLKAWYASGPALLLFAMFLLVLVLLPGVGKQVNGSVRWLALGPFQLQVSEAVKLLFLIYLAGYLVRRHEEVQTTARGFLKPMALLVIVGFLLLLEPDFGAAVVLVASSLGVMYLAGVRLWQFILLLLATAGAMAALAIFSPYRWARVVSFLDPWADPFNSGFQLTQSLIAFGRGEWFGVGLGGSIQKMFYLPEAHTDFVFAVLAEELGLIGVTLVILLFTFVVLRCLRLGALAMAREQAFAGYLAYGIGIWLGVQAGINIGVNMGVLPTKGLTLPLMSYGGSSLLVTCAAIGYLLRIGREVAESEVVRGSRRRRAT